jgi:hypothetical protein
MTFNLHLSAAVPSATKPTRPYRKQHSNSAEMARETAIYLRQRYGVMWFAEAKRCPGCGGMSYQRNPSTGVCRVCIQKASG